MLIKLHKYSLLNLTEQRKLHLESKLPAFKTSLSILFQESFIKVNIRIVFYWISLDFLCEKIYSQKTQIHCTVTKYNYCHVSRLILILNQKKIKRNLIYGFKRKTKRLRFDQCHLEKLLSCMYKMFKIKSYFLSGYSLFKESMNQTFN